VESVLAALASPENAYENALTQVGRERRQRCQRFDRIVVVGRTRPRRGTRKNAPTEIRSDDDPPKRSRRRETLGPLESGLSPKALFARTR
jgi:hypothetical protein